MAEELNQILLQILSGEVDGIQVLSSLHEKYPNSIEVLGHLATVYALKGHYQDSIDILKKYNKLQPENLEVRWRIGDRLINFGKLYEALEIYKEILKEHPDCVDAIMGVYYVEYLKRKKPDEKETCIPQKRQLSKKQEENLTLNNDEFKKQKLNLKSLPPYLFLESTTKCNYYCRTCAKGYGPYYAEDLQKDIFEKVQQEIMPTNVRISITGFGEPTLAKNFDEILQMCLENGSKVQFVTNASLFNFKCLEKLTNCPVDICLSIDGATEETFEKIRTGSKFDSICEKLAMIKKLRDVYFSEHLSQFSFLFVALRENIHELPDVIRLAHRYGIKSVGVADYSFIHRDFDEQSLRFEPEKANYYLEKAKKIADELKVNLHLPPEYSTSPPPTPKSSLWNKIKMTRGLFSEKKRFQRKCHTPWQEPYIRTDGTVVPCCKSNMYLGSLKKSSFEKIWNGWRYRLLRSRIHTNIPPLKCRNCNVYWGINNGNAGNVIAKEGLLVKAFYFFEFRIRGYGGMLKRFLRKVFYKLKGQEIPEPKPNYFRGRPLSKAKSTSYILDLS